MRFKIYNFLVNRVPGICQRYHELHDGNGRILRFFSWVYLLWLNFAYHILCFKWLGKAKNIDTYEEKRLYTDGPESSLFEGVSQQEMVEKLKSYDVISFDIFDTLVFRPFSAATDLFYFIGQRLGYLDFHRIRIEGEQKARFRKHESDGTYEVNLSDIWQELERATGISAEEGQAVETELELQFCYANSYMKQVYDTLLKMGKHIVITSDMYLPSNVLRGILTSCGYEGYEALYVSCDEGKSKWKGDLFDLMATKQREKYGNQISIAHVGDNENSDYNQAKKSGIDAFLYPNVNKNSLLQRSYDMSPIIGGAYRGIVNSWLYADGSKYSMNQEYGFVYGGLFVLGYCNFIHRYCTENNVDKLLFLSRDGEIIKRAYDFLYPNSNTEYVFISRLAAAKWTAGFMKYDFIRKLVKHKVGQGKTFKQILSKMEAEELVELLTSETTFNATDKLTPENVETFIDFINDNWGKLLEIYEPQKNAAGQWYRKVVGDAKNVVAIDIGWAGSGAIALKKLFEKEWNIDCKLTGIVAGTNSALNTEPEMSETFLLDGGLVSYMFSSMENRELWKYHNPNRGYNLYFELLTSSKEPSFRGFYYDGSGNVEARFSTKEPNPEGILEIQNGILEFIKAYHHHFKDFPFMFNISGRDAYAPMLLASSYNEKYLKAIYKNFDLTMGVE